MKVRFLLIFLFFMVQVQSCNRAHVAKNQLKQEPLVDIRNLQETVDFLCQLFPKLYDSGLNDAEYGAIQTQIEAIYIGLEFGVHAGFYSDEQILEAAEARGCLL